MLITALLVRAFMATPQLRQVPPEKLAPELLPLVSVLFRVEPVSRYTSVLFATHTVCPVAGFDEQELTAFGVDTEAGEPPPSIGTTWMPVVNALQRHWNVQPNGAGIRRNQHP